MTRRHPSSHCAALLWLLMSAILASACTEGGTTGATNADADVSADAGPSGDGDGDETGDANETADGGEAADGDETADADPTTDGGDDDAELPALPRVERTIDQIELVQELTQSLSSNTIDFDHYRNNAYECGLTGHYTFMVVNPLNGDETTEAPLWVYLHGGGSGYFDDMGAYRAVGGQDEDTFNHEETFDDLYVGQMQERMFENGRPKDITLTRRAREGYRLVFVSMCDHDQYLGLGTEYPNNPNAPKEVNGLQANMAAVDYVVAHYPTTHVFAHGTSAGSIGAYALGMSYAAEGVALTGVISDSVLAARGIEVQAELAGTPGFPQQEGYDPAEFDAKAGFYRQPENQIYPAQRIAAGFDATPLLFVGGLVDPFCAGNLPLLDAAAADGFDNNCEWVAAEVIEAVDAQPDSPHEVVVFDDEGHVPTNDVSPANDAVDAFIGDILAGDPPPPFGDSDLDPPDGELEGLNSLYMGHSYFRRQAEAMAEFAEVAGIDGHTSTSFFRGGYNGSAFAIWDDDESRATIQGYLDAGDVDMFGMTIFVETEANEGEGAHIDNQTQGIKNWIEYAAAQNPDTIFFVALPWLGRPLTYVGETGDPQTSGHEEYREVILQSEVGIRALIDELRDTFPDSEIFLLAYGQGSVELRTLYNQGNLPDVDTLVSGDGLLGIHRDTHGHAEQLLTDLNTLIWLESLYDYNVLNFARDFPYQTDIKQIAHDVANRQHPDYIRQFD